MTRAVTRGSGRALGLGLAVAVAGTSVEARAHHVPGHGASESVRTINSLGGRGGRAQSRLMLLTELSTDTASLNPGQTYNFSLLGEYAPLPSFSFGVQLPADVIDQREGPVRGGYGDTRAFLRYTPHADKLIHRILTFSLAASFPSRTYTLTADPGRRWSVTPAVLFTRTYGTVFWQAAGLASFESRPAGQALDLSLSGQLGVRNRKRNLALGGGAIVDVRALNFCTEVSGGSNFCDRSRPSEINREPGATRASVLATANYTFAPWGAVGATLSAPMTIRRDFDVAGSLSFQAMF